MKAVLLCAGYATRMGTLTANFPKALLPVLDRPILDYLIDDLASLDRVSELVVVTNHRDHAHFEAWLADRLASETRADRAAPTLRLIDDGTTGNENRLGAIGDLALAVEDLGGEEPLLVAAGDNLFRIDWVAWLRDLEAAHSSMVLVAHETDPERLRRSGVAELDEGGRLIRLWEKPADPPSEFCCPPLYWLTPEALAEIEPCRRANPEADAPGHLISWLAERVEIRTHEMRGKRLDVGNAQSYAAAGDWLQSH